MPDKKKPRPVRRGWNHLLLGSRFFFGGFSGAALIRPPTAAFMAARGTAY